MRPQKGARIGGLRTIRAVASGGRPAEYVDTGPVEPRIELVRGRASYGSGAGRVEDEWDAFTEGWEGV